MIKFLTKEDKKYYEERVKEFPGSKKLLREAYQEKLERYRAEERENARKDKAFQKLLKKDAKLAEKQLKEDLKRY